MAWMFRRKHTNGRPIVGDGAFGWLKRSGIVKEGEMVRRVVIDIAIDDVVLVYKEGYADGDSFNVNFPSGFKVVTNAIRSQDAPTNDKRPSAAAETPDNG